MITPPLRHSPQRPAAQRRKQRRPLTDTSLFIINKEQIAPTATEIKRNAFRPQPPNPQTLGDRSAMADGEQCGEEEYSKLKDLMVRLNRVDQGGGQGGEGSGGGAGVGFTLCFWIYLSGSARPSSVVLKQVYGSYHLLFLIWMVSCGLL